MHKEVSEGSSETEQKDTKTHNDTGVWLGTRTGFSLSLNQIILHHLVDCSTIGCGQFK